MKWALIRIAILNAVIYFIGALSFYDFGWLSLIADWDAFVRFTLSLVYLTMFYIVLLSG